jgi:predicted metalloprotease with PDZ domain
MKYFTFLFAFFLMNFVSAQNYKVKIDITKVQNDKLPIEMEFRGFDLHDSVEYQMPKIVPGTYSISDFGLVVDSIKAFDIKGNFLSIRRIDTNRWSIRDADKLHKISYWVEDTFDDKQFSYIFEPAGTNFEENNYLLNNFGVIGFLESYEKYPFSINIIHDEDMYGASPMKREVISPTEEVFFADNYLQLSDSPIMYCEPDTASVMIGETEVMVSVFSPSGKSDAEFMMGEIEPILRAEGDYLGGILPVDKYVILMYLHDKRTNSGAMGALEHSYSTVFSFPDTNPKWLSKSIVNTTSHEFFHIITPLTIHSEEIGDFNFIEPEMSKHLWLYEGVTEYSSMRVQVMYDLISDEDFLDEILVKMQESTYFNDSLPFTVMSQGALNEYEDQYLNVYEKGALIGMCLDLLLLKASSGDYDVRRLMDTLSVEYGVNKSFNDEELFDIIAELSYPETRTFFQRYVEGTEPLPIAEYLNYVGASYQPGEVTFVNTLGDISFVFDTERKSIVISDIGYGYKGANKLKFKSGDILYSLLGQRITMDDYQEIFRQFFSLEEGEKFEVVVIRKNKKGKEVKKTLKGKNKKVESLIGEKIQWDEDINAEQLHLRNKWINANSFK